jgi:hypothetical protein
MKFEEQAKTILEALEKGGIQIDWNFEQIYLKAIVNGLRDIKLTESK